MSEKMSDLERSGDGHPRFSFEDDAQESPRPSDEEGYDEYQAEYAELYAMQEVSNNDATIRNSTVESHWSDNDSDDDTDSSLTLFHAGYQHYSPTWDRQIPETSPPPLPPARHPSSRRQPPSRAPTALKLDSLPEDPNLVTWDKDDPANPHNWPAHRRWTSTVLIAMFAFIAPMASTMVAPALDTISDEFDLESKVEEFLVMSIFLLAFAIGPFLWGPLSEVFGRVRVMQGANMIFLLFNTVCGFARNKHQMMAFRFLAGIGGSAPQAVSCSIADMISAGLTSNRLEAVS